MRLRAGIAVVAILAVPGVSSARIVDLTFPGGRFEHAEAITPGKFLEICGKLDRAERVAWSFRAAAPLDFNIHYHVGDRVEYPEKRSGTASLEGVFEPPLAQHFCWMWRNTGSTDVTVTTTFLKG